MNGEQAFECGSTCFNYGVNGSALYWMVFSDKLLLEKVYSKILYSSPPSTLGKRSYKAETAEFQSYMQNCYNSYETLLHELLSYQPDEDDNLIRLSQEAFKQVQELARTEQAVKRLF